uniref:Uncharacterized protein n=1 Tax=Rhizophora mucronata TaxID=61149 RepID=A0A2P2L321_RHIMU
MILSIWSENVSPLLLCKQFRENLN